MTSLATGAQKTVLANAQEFYRQQGYTPFTPKEFLGFLESKSIYKTLPAVTAMLAKLTNMGKLSRVDRGWYRPILDDLAPTDKVDLPPEFMALYQASLVSQDAASLHSITGGNGAVVVIDAGHYEKLVMATADCRAFMEQ